MSKTNEKKQAGMDQGNAIENEPRETDPIEEIIRRYAEPGVRQEDSTLAEDHPDSGARGGKKY